MGETAMISRQDDSNTSQVLAALAIGLGVGFSLGILFAPNSGRKTRAAIAKTADRSLGEIKDRVDDIKSSATDLFEKGVQGVQAQKDSMARGVEHLKKAYREVAG
jgi:gas vesicle protein